MLIPISWLRQYVPIELPPRELAHRLTMAGLEIDDVREVGAEWGRNNVVVGHVVELAPHPNADRLRVPTIDLGGGETATVVCGGPNLANGQKIAFARVGAMLYNTKSGKTQPLKRTKIRGVESAGMVCSEVELGIGVDQEGILVLPPDAPVGADLVDYLGDAVLDASVTPNRPDCLSMLGVAHEVAALTGASVVEPDSTYPEEGGPIDDDATVEIDDPSLCSRYTASLVRGVRIGPSPQWLQDALESAGMRSINNVVDVTNYVMLEYGQPLHAFDFETVCDSRVIVRAARPGEQLATLDGEERALDPPMLVIADPRGAIAVAGVMGGQHTEVGESTTDILIESASFDAANTRKTASALGVRTEASHRFERGIRQELTMRALRRATKLVLDLAGGAAATGVIDVFPVVKTTPDLSIGSDDVLRVLGADVDIDRIDQTLRSLGFHTERTGDRLAVQVPYWRADISIPEDLVEEVARIIGYDDVPTTLMSGEIPHHEPSVEHDLREQTRDALVSAGLQETISYPATDLESLGMVEALGEGCAAPLKIANPIRANMSHMRTTLRASALETLAYNRRMSRRASLRLFEIGAVYLPNDDGAEIALPHEREMVVGVLSGSRFGASWLAPKGEMDFFDAKGALESVFERIGVSAEYEPGEDPIMLPGKTARVSCGDVEVGVVGELHPRVLTRFDIDDRVAMFEVDLQALYAVGADASVEYTPFGRYPDAERDIAVLVDADVPSSRIQKIIDRHRLVKQSAPFDLYTGDGAQTGKRSVAYRVTFQSDRSTLTGDLVDRARGDIVRQLERELGATLRGG